jgi:hypothetical protein
LAYSLVGFSPGTGDSAALEACNGAKALTSQMQEAGGMAQVVPCLPCMLEAQDRIPSGEGEGNKEGAGIPLSPSEAHPQ